MSGQRVNRVSGVVVIVLSLAALLLVVGAYTQPHQFAQTDEGAAARIFQLLIAGLFPAVLLFLATADWRRPWRNARLLAFSAAAVGLAFALVYYGEHYYR